MRRVLGLLASIAVAVIPLAFASPAQASTTYTYSVNCQSGGTVYESRSAVSTDVIQLNGGSGCRKVQVSVPLVSSTSSVVITGGGTLTTNHDSQVYRWTGTSDISSVSVTLQLSSVGAVDLNDNGGFPADGTQVTVTQGTPGPGPSPSNDTSAPSPVLETLTLQVSTGTTTCTGGSPTGYSGAWLQLPAADACSQTGPNANPNAKLLGWATSPLFPVVVAQATVDAKSWAIDNYFYGMRMIFIPAGGWTFVSGSNNLYPIWSN